MAEAYPSSLEPSTRSQNHCQNACYAATARGRMRSRSSGGEGGLPRLGACSLLPEDQYARVHKAYMRIRGWGLTLTQSRKETVAGVRADVPHKRVEGRAVV